MISVKDIKKLLQDEERMDGFRKFQKEFMTAKHCAIKKTPNNDESETITIECSENIILILEILFVNTDATNQAATRCLQDGVKPMRSC